MCNDWFLMNPFLLHSLMMNCFQWFVCVCACEIWSVPFENKIWYCNFFVQANFHPTCLFPFYFDGFFFFVFFFSFFSVWRLQIPVKHGFNVELVFLKNPFYNEKRQNVVYPPCASSEGMFFFRTVVLQSMDHSKTIITRWGHQGNGDLPKVKIRSVGHGAGHGAWCGQNVLLQARYVSCRWTELARSKI